MADKALSTAVESTSDSISAPEHVESSNIDASINSPRTRYFFGHRGSKLMSAISFAGSVGFFLFGYDQGVLGGINTSSDFLDQFGNPSDTVLGTINAIYEIGCFAGAINVFLVGEKLGRRNCLYIGAALMAIGAILQATSFGVPHMIVGRIVCGWGNGFNTATTPLWVSELSPAKSRGRLVAAEGSLIAFGIVVASYFNIGMSFTSGPAVWRAPIATQIVFIIIQAFMVMILPESPRWLAKHGRHHEAVDILAQLKGVDVPVNDPLVQRKKAEIDEILRLEAENGPWKLKECFVNGPLKIRRRYMLAIGVQAMQQLSGINLLVYYFPRILTTDLGMAHETSLHLAAGLSLTYWVFSFIPWLWLDRISRRKPLIFGALGCAMCFFVAGILQMQLTETRLKASLAFFFLYEAIFATGWLPVPWLYPAEIMPLRHRTHGAALATAGDWIFNYMIVQITPIMISNIRWKSYMVFFALNMLFAVVIWLFYPETSGRSLEELDTLWTGDNDRLVVVDWKGKLLPAFEGRYGNEAADQDVNVGAEANEKV